MSTKESKSSRATLFDVCRSTGLSTATVSRVLNGRPRVSEETRGKVMHAMAELGYVPNHAARSLAGQRQEMIGVVFPDIDTSFWAQILRGMDAMALQNSYHLLTAFSHGGRDERDLVSRLLREGRVDALVFMNMRLGDDFAAELAKSPIPVVLIDHPIEGPKTSAVTIDNEAGAYAAMMHLYSHGYRDVMILAGDAETYDSQRRLIGCRKAAEEARMPWDDSRVLPGAFTEQSGKELVNDWLNARKPAPRAIFALNDNLAVGAIMTLRRHGLRVPEDVAVVGFDDTDHARAYDLTTVQVPLQDVGRAAVAAALAAIKGESVNDLTTIPTRLVVRRSCGCEMNQGD